jgi:hypothetical protein
MKKGLTSFCALALLVGFNFNANAINIGYYADSTAEVDIEYSVDGTTITIDETWNTTGNLFLEIDGLESGTVYTVYKQITNSTGTEWTRFANELLDPVGPTTPDNDSDDPQPYPGFVPTGFTTSNDGDGLSFAQNQSIPRDSDVFDKIFVDELSDARDFIDYFDGTWDDGESGWIRFGLRDGLVTNNEPFLLAQRPNEFSVPEPGTGPGSGSEPVPEPATMLLVGSGLVGLLGFRRKFKKS